MIPERIIFVSRGITVQSGNLSVRAVSASVIFPMIHFDDLYFRKEIKTSNTGGIVFEIPVKKSLGRTMSRWKDNITTGVIEIT